MHPRTLVPNVDELKQVRIETRLLTGGAEKGFVRTGRARGHHNPVQIVLGDALYDLCPPGSGTSVHIVLHKYDVGQRPSVLYQLRHIQKASDVAPTVADKDTYPWT
jgi:hypothetical protein